MAGLVQGSTGTQPASVNVVGCIAFDDLVDEFARDHERDAALARIGTLHRVHVAEARRAPEVPALARAFDRSSRRVRRCGVRLLSCACQYSEASMIVRMRVVFCGSAGSSEPNSPRSSK